MPWWDRCRASPARRRRRRTRSCGRWTDRSTCSPWARTPPVTVRARQASGAGEARRLRAVARAATGTVPVWMLAVTAGPSRGGGAIARGLQRNPAEIDLVAVMCVTVTITEMAKGVQRTAFGALERAIVLPSDVDGGLRGAAWAGLPGGLRRGLPARGRLAPSSGGGATRSRPAARAPALRLRPRPPSAPASATAPGGARSTWPTPPPGPDAEARDARQGEPAGPPRRLGPAALDEPGSLLLARTGGRPALRPGRGPRGPVSPVAAADLATGRMAGRPRRRQDDHGPSLHRPAHHRQSVETAGEDPRSENRARHPPSATPRHPPEIPSTPAHPNSPPGRLPPEPFAASIASLSRRLRPSDPVFDREAVTTPRSVIDRIVVHPKGEVGTDEDEVIGHSTALVAPERNAGGKGVAEACQAPAQVGRTARPVPGIEAGCRRTSSRRRPAVDEEAAAALGPGRCRHAVRWGSMARCNPSVLD